jgi:MFS family permease
MRQPRFWILTIGLPLNTAPVSLLMVHGVPMLVDAGSTPAVAAAQFGLSGAGAAGCMMLLGHLADRWGAERAYTLGSLALMGGILVLCVAAPGREL